MKKYAVIVAGGSGTRMQSNIPKQFLEIKGKPVLWYTINSFLTAYDDLLLILVLPANMNDHQNLFDSSFTSRITTTIGGATRFNSVQNGLALIPKKEESIVFVHDGVRCMVSHELIRRCYESALIHKSAVPAVVSQDSIRFVDESGNKVVDRNKVYLIQTPQTFHSSVLSVAYEKEYQESFTDEASVVESCGVKINLIEGDYSNIKITRQADLQLAEFILSKRDQ